METWTEKAEKQIKVQKKTNLMKNMEKSRTRTGGGVVISSGDLDIKWDVGA